MRYALAAALCLAGASLDAQERRLTTPGDWNVVSERRSSVVDQGEVVTDSLVYFVTMSPGWHITTGPASLLFNQVSRADGSYSVEFESFLFPQSVTTSGVGLVLGGAGLGESGSSFVAFLVRGDGKFCIQRREGATSRFLVPWTEHSSVAPRRSGGTARNVLTARMHGGSGVFLVNGEQVAELSSLPTSGQIGMRVGDSVNIHVTRLSIVVP